jgi:menaquinone-dependent protoporphyrinogen oxidase
VNKSKEKILIAYASKSGSTAEVAEVIGQALGKCGASVDVRLAKEVTDISPYGAVIVGSPILYGKWQSQAVKFVKRHKETLSRIPVAYFLTCMELTRVFDEKLRDLSVYLDPSLGRPPKVEGKLSFFEKGHLSSAFLVPVLKKAPQVKPVSVGVFRGRLDYKKLDIISWLVMKLIWLISKGAPEGDFRNWEAIRSWAAGLSPALLPAGKKENNEEAKSESPSP